MKRRDSRSSSGGRRRHRSSRGKYESPSPERGYSHSRRDRERSRSRGKSRSRKNYYSEERSKYSPSEESNRAPQPFKIICVTALHADASDETIKDVIYSEFKRYGDLVVKISHSSEERVAYIYFKTSEDAKDALKNKRRLLIYDKVAILEPVFVKPRHPSPDRYRDRSPSRSPEYNDRYYRNRFPLPLTPEPPRYYERHPHYLPPMHIIPPEYRPLPGPDFMPMPHPMIHPMPHHPMYGPRPFIPYSSGLPYPPPVYQENVNVNVAGTSSGAQNQKKFPNYLHHIPPEDDPLATRTLFAGNLEIGTVKEDLIKIFEPYGVVEDIDVKRPAVGSGTAYAFVRFKNLDMAHKAKVELSGKFIGKFQLKIGYGKATPTTRIWVGGLGEWTSSVQLEREFDRFGAIKKIDYDKEDKCAYILYDSIDAATSAVKEMRGFPLGGPERKLRLDFADVGTCSPYGSDYEYRARKRSSRTRSRSPRSRSRSRSHSRHNGNRSADRSDDFSDDEHYKSVKRDRRPSSLGDAYSLADVIATCNTTWEGGFVLKNSIFPVKFHLTDGSSNVIDEVLDHESKHILRITQRLHLNPSKLNDVSKQISTAPVFGIFLAVPTSSIKLSFDDDASLQTKSIQNLILYLKQKEAAGVLTLDHGVLYAFPPCAFSMDLLKRTAVNVTDDNLKKDHLIIVVVKGVS